MADEADPTQELERLRVEMAKTHEALMSARAQLDRSRVLLERCLGVLDAQLRAGEDGGGT